MNAAQILRSASFVGDVQKRRNAEIIVEEFQSARMPAGLALAAVVNALAESGLNEQAVGDRGHSVGLFQLNDLKGKRPFDFDRTDPRKNTRWIAEEMARLWRAKGKIGNYTAPESMEEAFNRGASISEMAGLFTAVVERPNDVYGEMERRAALARSVLPESSVQQAKAVKYTGYDVIIPPRTDVDPHRAIYWWAAFIGAGALAGALLWRRFRT
jgi:hypothetical protein